MNQVNKQAEKPKTEKKESSSGFIAVVRVRGGIHIRSDMKDTLKMLNLHRKNYCIILKNNPVNMGMVKKVKDYVTYGTPTEETIKLLKEKKAEKDKKFFRLSPPRKGFGRKGIKKPFNIGGGLGDRKEKINDLIKRMI